jgi:hypothetical protein
MIWKRSLAPTARMVAAGACSDWYHPRSSRSSARTALADLEVEWAQALGEERFSNLYDTLRDLVAVVDNHVAAS